VQQTLKAEISFQIKAEQVTRSHPLSKKEIRSKVNWGGFLFYGRKPTN
jgi:hypothetical protein